MNTPGLDVPPGAAAPFDRVFGRHRLRMVTGQHVEVFREEARAGERRRYTKRFLATDMGDFRAWTEREWRILARLVGHGIACVPEVARFDRGSAHEPAVVQTYDAGITVDHWATLLPVQRDGRPVRHVFEDCAHWWALARHLLLALDAIHELRLVHLDLKADNVCIPASPPDFDPGVPGQQLHLRFEQLALIDFAFSLVCGDPLATALPLARQPDYDYQSPRLLAALQASRTGDLRPTRELDWRCDFYSLAALMARYLPDSDAPPEAGWTAARLHQAVDLLRRLHAIHDADLPAQRPHADLADDAAALLRDPALSASLARGWLPDPRIDPTALRSPTPITRIALPLAATPAATGAPPHRPPSALPRRWAMLGAGAAALVLAVPLVAEVWQALAGDEEADPPARVAAAPAADPVRAVDPAPAAREAAPIAAPPDAAASSAAAPADASAPQAIAASAVAAPAPLPSSPLEQPGRSAQAAQSFQAAPADQPDQARQPDHADHRDQPGQPAQPARRAAPPAAPAAPAPTPAAGATKGPGPATSPSRAATAANKPAVRPGPPPAVARRDATPRGRQAQAPAERRVAPPQRKGTAAPPPAPRAVAAARPAAPLPAAKNTAERQPWLEPRAAARTGAAAPVAPVVSTRPPPTLPPPSTEHAVLRPAPAPTPSASTPSPITVPAPAPLPAPAPPAPPRDLQARADTLLATELPRIAERAERLVLRVLFTAGRSDGQQGDDEIRQAATTLRLAPAEALAVMSASEARALDDAAQQAQRRGDLAAAISLLTRAFAANPLDADIAGDLAALRLRSSSAHAAAARQLALHALTTPHARHPQGRLDDWTTLAIASALTGRERDARHAWYVTLALAPNTDRLCRIAVNAYVRHGERVRPSIDALLQRAEASGRASASAACDWPPRWAGNSR